MDEFQKALDDILLKTEDGLKLIPELYTVPADKVNAEYLEPHSQERIVKGKVPFIWAQSLYILGRLLQEVRISSVIDVHYHKEYWYSSCCVLHKDMNFLEFLGIFSSWRIGSSEPTSVFGKKA